MFVQGSLICGFSSTETTKRMKKLFILLLFLALGAVQVQAQKRHQIEIYMGGLGAEFDELNLESNRSDLFSLYEPQTNAQSEPVFTLSYTYSLLKWLRLGLQMDYTMISGNSWYRLGNKPSTSFKKDIFYALPQVQAMVPGLPHLRPYARIAAGIQVNTGEFKGAPVQFAFDLVPLGIEWGGQRVYGTAEISYGSVVRGGRLGIGFRF